MWAWTETNSGPLFASQRGGGNRRKKDVRSQSAPIGEVYETMEKVHYAATSRDYWVVISGFAPRSV
jgi:hypothetical protein